MTLINKLKLKYFNQKIYLVSLIYLLCAIIFSIITILLCKSFRVLAGSLNHSWKIN